MRVRTFFLLTIVVGTLVHVGCGGKHPPVPDTTGDPDGFGSFFADPPAAGFTARLFLTFEGGFLEEDRLKINGQLATAWPDRLRLIGAYGALRKVFDLTVTDGRFSILDHREHVLYVGDALDAGAAERLGFALRPGDLLRLLRLGGRQIFEDAEILSREAAGDSVRVTFTVPGDPARWSAGIDARRGWVRGAVRELDGRNELVVRYDGHFRRSDRTVPRRIAVTRPGRDERVDIEVRSIRFRDEMDAELFEPRIPDETRVVDLSDG